MRYVPTPTVSLGKMFWAALLACCLQISVVVLADDSSAAKSGDENLQAEGLKRQWERMQGGWGLKSTLPLNDQIGYSTPDREKRAWQNLQGVWGKRFAPSEDDLTIQELASILEQDSKEAPPVDDNEFDIHEDKRSWDKFVDGWGKRNKWEKFRGSWGKREPAWSNLKGIWGKRSLYQYAN
ncbi:prothoracicostatic peptide [Anoplophora glabripennis]|uniref:prothoracicostatic peptide n=1 Tax=Anoplophora glabripennis TaxID=217634 RepID=UPI0008743528|nr:prothoracicostatic peptide [Anoplophora glabripennis]